MKVHYQIFYFLAVNACCKYDLNDHDLIVNEAFNDPDWPKNYRPVLSDDEKKFIVGKYRDYLKNNKTISFEYYKNLLLNYKGKNDNE